MLADRYERKRLILLARGTCGVGFVGLCLNALLPEPSLAAIYLLGIWDGFFASLGVTALLAATPALVGGKPDAGRGHHHVDGAPWLSDFADDRRPAAGHRRRGVELRPGGGGDLHHHLNPAASAAAAAASAAARASAALPAGGADLPLPEPAYRRDCAAWRSADHGQRGAGAHPALAGSWQMSAGQIGLLYAAIPLGAALGASTSGQLAQTVRPGALMLATTVGSFVAIALFSLMPHWALGALCLALFGWLSAISSLLQYTLIQTQTPEHMLGRINGLWTAQNVTGDAIGAALLGGLGAVMTPAASASASGWALALVGVLLVGLLRELRRFQRPEIVNES